LAEHAKLTNYYTPDIITNLSV